LNYQAHIIDQIPQKNFQLYYLADSRPIFTLYWKTKDTVKLLTEENFFEIIDLKNSLPGYVIGDGYVYDNLPKKEQEALKLITCTNQRKACLYELLS
jgi:hypothetical protein